MTKYTTATNKPAETRSPEELLRLMREALDAMPPRPQITLEQAAWGIASGVLTVREAAELCDDVKQMVCIGRTVYFGEGFKQ